MASNILLEQHNQTVKLYNYNTKKNMKFLGSSSIDMSGSTGTFKFPSGSVSGLVNNVISGQGATATLTAAQSGSVALFDRAAGIVYTLPAPVVGLNFGFYVSTTVTSNNHKVITDTGTTLIAGLATSGLDNTANKQWVANGSTHIAATMNGTTTGGIIGSFLEFTCVTSTLWVVSGTVVASGTPTTIFTTS
jgi:hypothetical protein